MSLSPSWLRPLRRRLAVGGAVEGTMVVLGALTGLLTGMSAWLLVTGIEAVQELAWLDGAMWERLLFPTLGGLLVGALVRYVVPEAADGGVVGTMESIALRGGRFRAVVPLATALAVILALGLGLSGGRESPMLLIGGSIGGLVASMLPLDEQRRLALVSGGAAAGIGAAFNAPIGGMLFSMEVLLGGRRGASMQVIVISSVVASVTAQQLVGAELIYQPQRELSLGSPYELLAYALLGLLAVAVATALRASDGLVRRVMQPVRRRVGLAVTVAIGGLGTGLVALWVPQVLGSGDALPPVPGSAEPIQTMLDAGFEHVWPMVGTLGILLVAKTVATSLTHGSGAAVGLFAPSLFLGAALGGGLGIALQMIFPSLQVGAMATVGMAAVFAALVRAPLTAILLVFELVGDYGLVLPLMTAVGIATLVADRVHPHSVYQQQIRDRGIVFGRSEDIDVLQAVAVREVMSADSPTIPATAPRDEIEQWFTRGGSHGYAVTDADGRLEGVLTVRDLAREGDTAAEICTSEVAFVSPEDPVYLAVRRMASLDVGRLPVVDRETERVVGMVRRADVVQAYQRGISRSLGQQQRQATQRLRDLAGVQLVELVVDAGSTASGACVKEIDWPQRTVVASIQRRGSVVVPTGDTRLEAGDQVTLLTADPETLRALLTTDAQR